MTSSGPGENPVERRAAGARTPTRTRQAAESSPDDGTPQAAAANGAQSAPPDDTRELQQQIEQTREQLGETVDQLVAKADVMARAKGKAADLADRVKGQAGQARAQAAARAGSVRDQVTSNAAAAGQRAVYVGTAAKDQLVATGGSVWQAAPEPARQAVAKGASRAKEHRVPLAVAVSALIAGLLVIRWWRKR
jgi:Protein of unknown function (DUF3618)